MGPQIAWEIAYAAHQERVARIEAEGWMDQDLVTSHPLREALAAVLLALAGRLAPATQGQAIASRPRVGAPQP